MDADLGVQELNLVYMKVSLVCIFLSYYVDFPCLKLKISITTGLIQLSFLGKLYFGFSMVLDCFVSRVWDGFRLFFCQFYTYLNTKHLTY